MKIFLFLILLLLCCKSIQDSKPNENPEDKALIKKWIVTPDSGLNLRDAPSRKAKSIRLLPRGTMVNHKQLPENEKPETIEEQKGKWLKVEVGNESGWVFDVYLSEPVFSPSGDKFYFYTIKDLVLEKIISLPEGYCKQEYSGISYRCLVEIKNKENTETIEKINRENIIGWYDSENLLIFEELYDGCGKGYVYYLIGMRKLEEKLIYNKASETFDCSSKKRYFAHFRVCIFDKCLEIERKENTLKVFWIKLIPTEKFKYQEENLIQKFGISNSQDFIIKELTQEQILKLKHPYTGNIEFSVDKRNYLLHVPTGKITEVKEK